MFLTEGDKRAQRLSFDRRNQIETSFVCFLWFEEAPTFQRNLALVSVLYIGERPEITPHDEESKKAKTRKEIK